MSNNEYPKILISGDYNVFNEGWNGNGVYMCSGLYQSETFKMPVYIGSAGGKNGLQERIEYGHINPLNRNNHNHNPPLQYSWNKYGPENFVWFLLEFCDADLCLEREQYYLDLFRPFLDEFRGFNINHSAKKPPPNSFKGRKHTAKTKERISKIKKGTVTKPETKEKLSRILSEKYKNEPHPNKGKKMSEENRLKMSESKREFYKTNPHHSLGYKHTEEAKRNMSEGQRRNGNMVKEKNHRFGISPSTETRAKMREAHIGKPHYKTRKPINQIDPETDEIIKVWSSAQEAADHFGRKGYSSLIFVLQKRVSKRIRQPKETWAGFKWEYVNKNKAVWTEEKRIDFLEKNPQKIRKYKKLSHGKPIKQIDRQTNEIIHIWFSMEAVYTHLGKRGSGALSDACRGKVKSAYGYKWEYATNKEYEDFISNQHNESREIPRQTSNRSNPQVGAGEIQR